MLMYMKEPEGDLQVAVPRPAAVALAVAAVTVLVMGVYPAPFLEYAQNAVLSIH